MSWNPALDPSIPIGDAVDAIETVIVPRARDLGKSVSVSMQKARDVAPGPSCVVKADQAILGSNSSSDFLASP
jgi:hypothetical protein